MKHLWILQGLSLSLLATTAYAQSIEVGTVHSESNSNLVVGTSLGNTHAQVKLNAQHGKDLSNALLAVNVNGERAYSIAGASIAKEHDYDTHASGAYLEGGYVFANGVLHHISTDASYQHAKSKTLSTTTTPYSSSRVIATNVSTEEQTQGNQKITYTHTDTTTEYINGTRTDTLEFTGGHQTRVGLQLGVNTFANGITTARVDHYNHSAFEDETVGTLAHTQYIGQWSVMLGATTQKDLFARAEYQVGNAMTVFGGVQHNVDSQQTDVLTGVRIAFDGGRTVAKPTTTKTYGNHRFEQVNTTEARYAVQNPLQLGRIVTTTTDEQTVTTQTKRETTKTVETIKYPVDITALDNFMKNLPTDTVYGSPTRIIDLTWLPEWFTIVSLTAQITDRGHWYLEVKSIGEKIYEINHYHNTRFGIWAEWEVIITTKDINGDEYIHTHNPGMFYSQVK